MRGTLTPRAWVGCLACYNDGRLVGNWVDGAEAGAFVPCDAMGHEEWWVFDVEGYAGTLAGECSPSEAQRLAELLTSADVQDIGAVLAYSSAFGENLADVLEDLSGFDDSYAGEWNSREEFAQDMAENLGVIPAEYSWPVSCIDWERAARDLFMDYSDEPAADGRLYVFRNV